MNLTDEPIEFVSVFVKPNTCAWEVSKENDKAFYATRDKNLTELLILNWSFINHSDKKLVLRQIGHRAKSLPRGIGGVPQPSILKSLTKFGIPINFKEKGNLMPLTELINVPAGQAFQFETELFHLGNDGSKYAIDDRVYIDFNFEFTNGLPAFAPRIFINCDSEDPRFRISFIS